MFRILNMRTARIDDLKAKARIRDAAMRSVAEDGVPSMTARKIAAAAGGSPALVIHHFGSMKGLRSACDEYVASRIREANENAASVGPEIDLLAAIREADFGPLSGYLAAVLVEDSPAVAKLVDVLVDDAEGDCRRFVEAGMMRPTTDYRGRAAVLLLWSLGALVMHKHMQRILGCDLTDRGVGSDSAIAAYAGPAYEILGKGILTEEFAAHAQDSFAEVTSDVTAHGE